MSIHKHYHFIDESGDPEFYGAKKKLLIGHSGYQPYLIIGMMSCENRKQLRNAVLEFRNSILSDPLYNDIPSIRKAGVNWIPHARSDHPEIRAKFFEFLRRLSGYQCSIVIGRKDIDIFSSKHNSRPEEFYFDLLHHLLKEKFKLESNHHHLYLAHRKSTNLSRFESAIHKATNMLETNIIITQDIVKSSEYPEMSVIDYILWAEQRKTLKNETRFFNAINGKLEFVLDLYPEDKPRRETEV